METITRIKSNIVEFALLYTVPCDEWLVRFVDGKIDAHESFKLFGEEYEWLYENSPYDLIGWEIEHGVFNWEEHSKYVAQFCPEYFDSDKYNWEKYSDFVAEHCSHLLDPEKFNWANDSWAVAMYCPDKLDPIKFDWEKYSDYVARYCPELLKLKPTCVIPCSTCG